MQTLQFTPFGDQPLARTFVFWPVLDPVGFHALSSGNRYLAPDGPVALLQRNGKPFCYPDQAFGSGFISLVRPSSAQITSCATGTGPPWRPLTSTRKLAG